MSSKHWTDRSAQDFLYRIGSDFVSQIEKAMEKNGVNQAELAKKVGVSEGRISQLLNNPGNFTLRSVVQVARALGNKVSIIAYDDGDPGNRNGPVNALIFELCWERAGRPTDFFAAEERPQSAYNAEWQDLGGEIHGVAGTTLRAVPGDDPDNYVVVYDGGT